MDGCQDGDPFFGASFQFLAANVKYKTSGETIFPGYKIHHFPGVKVGLIGMTLEATPSIVSLAGISHVDFLDEAETVNALVPELRRQGVETIIVLLHEGGSTSAPLNETTINSCVNPTGAIPPIVAAMDDAVDVVVTGHTNWAVKLRHRRQDRDGRGAPGPSRHGYRPHRQSRVQGRCRGDREQPDHDA